MKPNPPIDWLLQGEPYIEYGTRLDLLHESTASPTLKSARRRMLESPPVAGLLNELSSWPGQVIASHKSAGQPFHKLTFLADLGLKAKDPGMPAILERILAHQSEEGPFQLPMNIGEAYGGTGRETWGWALCDAPLTVYALARFGLGSRPPVKKAAAHLAALVRENGWPCAVSKELGKWRGPGRKEDPCPFANLAMLKALSEMEAYREGEAARLGAETLLRLWSESESQHPYIFYMGTDFRKLKVPLVWYDLVHVLEVLARFEWLRGDRRLRAMLAVLREGMDPDGRFTNGSVWTAWKDWEFGQKKVPSRWLTLTAWKIIGRIDG